MTKVKNYFPVETVVKKRKGRSNILINSRDKKLMLRFYYYSHIKRETYKYTMQQLVNEFYICERVIIDRLKICQNSLDNIFATKPSISELRKMFPFLVW